MIFYILHLTYIVLPTFLLFIILISLLEIFDHMFHINIISVAINTLFSIIVLVTGLVSHPDFFSISDFRVFRFNSSRSRASSISYNPLRYFPFPTSSLCKKLGTKNRRCKPEGIDIITETRMIFI